MHKAHKKRRTLGFRGLSLGTPRKAAYDDRVDFIRELEAVPGIAAAVKTAEFLNDAFLSVMCGYHDVSFGCRITVIMFVCMPDLFILRCRREISEDLRLAGEINALCARVIAIVDERESFVDELDMLAGRHVPGKRCFHREAEGERGLLNLVVFCVFLVC
ncbi:hypothetical protein Tco_1462443 [Tanacetum coccineum]